MSRPTYQEMNEELLSIFRKPEYLKLFPLEIQNAMAQLEPVPGTIVRDVIDVASHAAMVVLQRAFFYEDQR